MGCIRVLGKVRGSEYGAGQSLMKAVVSGDKEVVREALEALLGYEVEEVLVN